MTTDTAALMRVFGLDTMPHVVCWAVLAPDEAAAQLHMLASWVAWFQDRYRLDHRTVPPCWADHGDLVEELSALRSGWQSAYQGGARLDAPLTWHTHLHAARARLREHVAGSGCRPGQHRTT